MYNPTLPYDVTSTFTTGNNINVSLPNGQDITSLVPTFITDGFWVEVSGASQTSGVTSNDFTSSITYTVIAEDLTTQDYTINVTEPVVKRVASSGEHTLILKNDGTVWAWGRNDKGQLGDTTTSDSIVPIQVKDNTGSDLTGIIAISARTTFVLALKNDGTVWAWGENHYAQLGRGSTAPAYEKQAVQTNITGTVVQISAGGLHALALKDDGTVWGWGRNHREQVLKGGADPILSPVATIAPNSKMIACGAYHSIVATTDNKVLTWGDNQYGQLGDNTWTSKGDPELTFGGLLNNPSIIVGGYTHNIVKLANGDLYSWGNNKHGQLGIGHASTVIIPNLISSGTNIYQISGSKDFSICLTYNGELYAMGRNNYGQIGDSTTTSEFLPMDTGLSGYKQIAVGREHVVALGNDNKVYTWGKDTYGQLGNGAAGDSDVPVQVSVITNNVMSIASGEYHSCAIDNTNNLFCWGRNNFGQVGAGSMGTDFQSPQPVTLHAGVSNLLVDKVACGDNHTLAVNVQGKLCAWGNNANGQVGNSSTTNTAFPQVVDPILTDSDTVVFGDMVGTFQIAAGGNFSMALKNSNKVYTWGSNVRGQLGRATATQPEEITPKVVIGDYSYIGAGGETAYAANTNSPSEFVAWGSNLCGTYGNGTTGGSGVPLTMSGIQYTINISAGPDFLLIAKDNNDGNKIYAWGCNQDGELGVGLVGDRYIPLEISGHTNPKSISAGYDFSCVITGGDDRIYCSGYYPHAYLGANSVNFRDLPTLVTHSF